MAKAKKHGALSIRRVSGTSVPATSTPAASLLPNRSIVNVLLAGDSTHETKRQALTKPFPFLSLPSELRNKVYELVFATVPDVLDLDPTIFAHLKTTRALAIFSVNRQVHSEAVHNFFSTHTVRLFPTYPGRYFKAKRPLLARFPQKYRSSTTSLQLRLGPGWGNPPRGWVVNDALGLVDCTNVRVLKVFVECDPSDPIFQGFRASEGFYERFGAALLQGVLDGVPSIKVVEFDGYSSVQRTGDMIRGLLRVAVQHNKVIGWGPERGWKDEIDQTWYESIVDDRVIDEGVTRTVVVLA